jgi:ATP-dependent Lon protease
VRNGPDLEDVPEEVREVMTFHLATTIADVLIPALAGGEGAPVVEEQGTELGAAA